MTELIPQGAHKRTIEKFGSVVAEELGYTAGADLPELGNRIGSRVETRSPSPPATMARSTAMATARLPTIFLRLPTSCVHVLTLTEPEPERENSAKAPRNRGFDIAAIKRDIRARKKKTSA